MAVTESMEVSVNAPADQVLAFLRDIDNQHNWFPGNLESEVLERDEEDRCVRARMVNDVKVAKDEFALTYTHTEDGFSWTLVEATRVQKSQQGNWQLVDKGGRTLATMTLTVDTALPLPGFIQKKTVKDTLKGATSALAKQF
ncbi:MAG: SRPBCC family protein [Candidatus Nanopelagicales bacterium]